MSANWAPVYGADCDETCFVHCHAPTPRKGPGGQYGCARTIGTGYSDGHCGLHSNDLLAVRARAEVKRRLERPQAGKLERSERTMPVTLGTVLNLTVKDFMQLRMVLDAVRATSEAPDHA